MGHLPFIARLLTPVGISCAPYSVPIPVKPVGLVRNVEEVANLDWQHHVSMARSAADAIERLSADLDAAIEVAFDHGAGAWVQLNYPDHYERLRRKAEEK